MVKGKRVLQHLCLYPGVFGLAHKTWIVEVGVTVLWMLMKWTFTQWCCFSVYGVHLMVSCEEAKCVFSHGLGTFMMGIWYLQFSSHQASFSVLKTLKSIEQMRITESMIDFSVKKWEELGLASLSSRAPHMWEYALFPSRNDRIGSCDGFSSEDWKMNFNLASDTASINFPQSLFPLYL